MPHIHTHEANLNPLTQQNPFITPSVEERYGEYVCVCVNVSRLVVILTFFVLHLSICLLIFISIGIFGPDQN